MNTHDIDIELPPLPEARIVSYQTDSTMRRMELRTYSDKDMKDYARAAVEADRQRRGEPVAYLQAENLVRLAQPHVAGCAASIQKEPADGLFIPIFTAPQPAETVKSHLTVKYDDKRDCLYVFCDNNEPTEAEENEQGILLWRAYSDGRLVGVTIPNFIGPMSSR